MRILIFGDRRWKNLDNIITILNVACQYVWDRAGNTGSYNPNEITVIEGEATGADQLGRIAAIELGIPESNILRFPAPWGDIDGKPNHQIGIHPRTHKKYWKAAGPFRNVKMLVEGAPTLALGFHNDIENSVGSADMMKRAIKAGIDTRTFKESDFL